MSGTISESGITAHFESQRMLDYNGIPVISLPPGFSGKFLARGVHQFESEVAIAPFLDVEATFYFGTGAASIHSIFYTANAALVVNLNQPVQFNYCVTIENDRGDIIGSPRCGPGQSEFTFSFLGQTGSWPIRLLLSRQCKEPCEDEVLQTNDATVEIESLSEIATTRVDI